MKRNLFSYGRAPTLWASPYTDIAKKETLAKGIGHEPQLFDRCFKMLLNLERNGTMKVDNWDIKIEF